VDVLRDLPALETLNIAGTGLKRVTALAQHAALKSLDLDSSILLTDPDLAWLSRVSVVNFHNNQSLSAEALAKAKAALPRAIFHAD